MKEKAFNFATITAQTFLFTKSLTASAEKIREREREREREI
jgi:hypothetical protein